MSWLIDKFRAQRAKPKRRWWRIAVEVLFMIAIVLALRAYLQRDIVTGPAPAFAGTQIDGTPVALAQYRGAPVLIHFWATWCPICKAEQGSIAAIAQDHRVIAIAMQSGGAATVAQYLREQRWAVPVLVDEDGTLARAYGVRGVPASFVVDGTGIIRNVEVGYTTEWGLRLRLWWAGRQGQ